MLVEQIKYLSRIGVLPVMIGLTSASALMAAPGADRLFEVNLALAPNYRSLLLSKLGPTPFDCGRFIAEPAFAAEYSVSVYSQPSADGEVKYFITYTASDKSLWETSNAGKDTKAARNINVHRLDCEIPRAIAQKTKQVWFAMLTDNQRRRPMHLQDAGRVTDATIGEFSLQLSPAKAIYGEMPVEAPVGVKTKTLVDIANALIEYYKAKPATRADIATTIDSTTTELLSRLKH
ncbi:MAG TPA: hypothetical protein VFA51_13400 [Candidatus Udaeobacter sp.]|nr:hypothetical protein [Candidatus Udaeobacter sp.]